MGRNESHDDGGEDINQSADFNNGRRDNTEYKGADAAYKQRYQRAILDADGHTEDTYDNDGQVLLWGTG